MLGHRVLRAKRIGIPIPESGLRAISKFAKSHINVRPDKV